MATGSSYLQNRHNAVYESFPHDEYAWKSPFLSCNYYLLQCCRQCERRISVSESKKWRELQGQHFDQVQLRLFECQMSSITFLTIIFSSTFPTQVSSSSLSRSSNSSRSGKGKGSSSSLSTSSNSSKSGKGKGSSSSSFSTSNSSKSGKGKGSSSKSSSSNEDTPDVPDDPDIPDAFPLSIVWETSQDGLQADGGWEIDPAGRRVRFNVEDSENCGASNSVIQSGTATATITTPSDYLLLLDITGNAELENTGFEVMSVTLDGTEVVSATSNNLNQGCEMGPPQVTFATDPPFLLTEGTHTFEITFTTGDDLFHLDAFYQFELAFEEVSSGTSSQVQPAPESVLKETSSTSARRAVD